MATGRHIEGGSRKRYQFGDHSDPTFERVGQGTPREVRRLRRASKGTRLTVTVVAREGQEFTVVPGGHTTHVDHGYVGFRMRGPKIDLDMFWKSYHSYEEKVRERLGRLLARRKSS